MRQFLLSAAVLPMLLLAAVPAKAAASPDAKACSNEATAKGLHGADREAFRAACLKAAPASKPGATMTARPAAVPTAARPASGTGAASRACSDQATAKGLHGADRETFRSACLKGAPALVSGPAPTAKLAPPVVAAATPPEPGTRAARAVKPAATPGSRSPAQLAADRRIHACGQQWQAAKAAGKLPGGQTWPKFWSACSARMKAA